MKLRGVILGLLAAIAGLLAVLTYKGGSPANRPAPSGPAGGHTVVTNTITQIAVRKVNATNLLAALANRLPNWNSIESTNYAVYIANLRSIGCPEETIRDIILTDVAKLYAKRRAELRGPGYNDRFWETGGGWDDGYGSKPEIRRQLLELEKEQRALVKELLGVDYRAEMAKYWLDVDEQERRYGFLPQDKREKMAALKEKYDELEQELQLRTKGIMIEEDQLLLNKLQREREEELAKILTPEELEEYELRNSGTASSLRSRLNGFQPSEEEFRQIFRLQKTFDEEFNQVFDRNDDLQAEFRSKVLQESQEAMNEEIKSVLGEERFAEYQRAQDDEYQVLTRLTERLDLPKELAARVYDMKQEAERQKQRIVENSNLTDDQREAALAAIARETEKSVSATLGPKTFQTYQKTGSRWISGLTLFEREPPPPAPPVENEVTP